VFNAQMIRDKLGLKLEEPTQRTAARYGLDASDGFLVAAVDPDSPAGAAGMQPGMLITSIDGQLPSDLCEAAKLLYAKKPGETVQLGFPVLQRMGSFNIRSQGVVELAVR
jgi:S1-C subfamily serine protease